MIIIILSVILINLIIFYYLDKISKIINLYDLPNQKLKLHKKKTSLIGGTIFVFNIILLFIFDQFISINFFDIFLIQEKQFIFLIILVFFFIAGFYDDKKNLNSYLRFFLLILMSAIYIFLDQNLLIKKVTLSFYDHKIFFNNYSTIFTIFCFIILINALNFYDGINGQSLLYFIFTFSYLFFLTNRHEFYGFILIILIFLLVLNFKNKLFLGDNGIYSLGITLSASIIYEHNAHNKFIFADEIFLLLLLPGLDLLRLTIFRLYQRKNPFIGDRNHIHHLLIKRYSLFCTNLILIILAVMPIFASKILKLDFFMVIMIFFIIYSSVILKFHKYESF
jgi:UDP-GlcNAc:undecaprenyl-phosphate GlcNAc-1-phosphate transferase